MRALCLIGCRVYQVPACLRITIYRGVGFNKVRESLMFGVGCTAV